MADFYDELASCYHLIYSDWSAGIDSQADALHAIIRLRWGDGIASVLDVSCGIGTQAIGLAHLGFNVTGSELSASAIERVKQEPALIGAKPGQ